jgi:hypothetical protein
MNFLKKRLDAYKKMFPTLDCLGWYKTGTKQTQDMPSEEDWAWHKQVQQFCESPLLLILNTASE